jgi:hypothetical protein
MKVWQTGDVIMATDVNRWEESVATFTATLDGGNLTINDIGYDELKAMVTAGRLPRVMWTLEEAGIRQVAVETLYQFAVESDEGGTPTSEYLVSTPASLQFAKQSDGSAMATM